ncbi:hypothetical protein INS49_006832 [Diaporthe citri]|uniref:uncharacterized protein n=1 Tax=Diaporthe citri TaxID=83186 RepID=UPI001C810BDE|nr:uncharacterized protein INS49_006832 [Diaporthe citri]KAG6365223.1 hypothetical protein INS49_006832 [Diaporthe citri]
MADVPPHRGPSTRDGHSNQPEGGNTHNHALAHPPRSTCSPTRPETFLCTFCWRPQRSDPVNPSGAPKVVCGEVVFRGDECVSLGWCFWHRGCYGCLFCGNRRVVEGVSVEELLEDAGSRVPDRSTELGRGKGREIDEIPLCGPCVEEVSRETTKDDHLIPMALRRIDRYDGGLSRRRWEEATGKSTHEDHGHETPSSLSSHPELEQQAGILATSARSKEKHVSRTPSPIYVSMHDPVGEPAFRRSETKPIPKWMQYLPGKRSDELDCVERPSSVLDVYFSPPDSSVAESDSEPSIRRSPSPPPVPAHIIPH